MKKIILTLMLGAGLLNGATEFSEEDVAFFSNEVRPLLEANCIKCHGGEDKNGKVKVKSGLQLISRKGIVMGGEHGSAFDEKEPGKSLLLHVISYEDDDLKMPPKSQLEPEVVAVFKEWVERGLPWTPGDADRLVEVHVEKSEITEINETTKNYWSYKPMVRPEVPKVDDAEWAGPIDAFLYAGIRKAGLHPNAEASRGKLIRRAYYNMIGLPPSLAEVREFENDQSADAWEKVVDRLLASTAYGEKWGKHWLDVMRYAETNGFERDLEKAMVWRYRDYVIDAFNEDKPYDEFLREQLAGDELAEPTLQSMIATGYHRLMQWDDEAADKKQHMYDVLDDNVRTTTEGVLGMTMGCARCHDHKGDPIPQEDYYSFMSFFRGLTKMKKGPRSTERVLGGDDGGDYDRAMKKFEEEREKLGQKFEQISKQIEADLIAKHPEMVGRIGAKGSKGRVIMNDARSPKLGFWHYTTKKPSEDWSAVSFRAENHGWKQGPGGFGTKVPGQKARTHWGTPDLWLQATFELKAVPKMVWISLFHDEDVEMFLNGQHVLARKGHVADYRDELVGPEFLTALQTGRNTLAVHVKQTAGGQFFDLGMTESRADMLTLEEAMKLKSGDFWKGAVGDQWRRAQQVVRKVEERKPKQGLEVMAVTEAGTKVPPTYVHIRGSANAEDTDREVKPRVPGIFGGEELVATVPANGRKSSGRRTALADWICRDDNPRTARVMMNRVWQHHFGRGICPTPNDFGYLGELPTHPELLDWLATEFVKEGWSLKAMHRQILMSRAFRMSSRGTEEGLAKDPDNKAFWRFEMRRLTAEEARDSILSLTGTLNRKQGGPSVYIPLPPEVLATSSKKGASWGKSSPEDEVRRSVYVKVKRSMVPPQFADLDVADTDASCPVRFVTTVPTQALGFLNSAFMNDQAKILAKRLREEAGAERSDRVRLGLELALSRPATTREMDYGTEFFETMRTEHELSEDEALDRFALLVLNLNEFIFLD